MTEKRYYVIHDNTDGIDKVRDRYTHSYMSADNICYKLNELQELEKEVEIYQTLYEQLVEFELETIKSLKEDFHNIRKAQFEDVKEFEKLYKENDELKEEIKTLRCRLSFYETVYFGGGTFFD